jgi:hypothetical protein
VILKVGKRFASLLIVVTCSTRAAWVNGSSRNPYARCAV